VKHPDWSWLPNGLTILRFAAGVMLPWVPADWQFTVLLAAGVSDLVDGWLGRWLRVTSNFGQIADPIADKTLVLVAVLCAMRAEWLSWPELFALAARDLTVLVLSGLALANHRENWRKLTPRLSGKIATGAQIVALLTLFWFQHPQPILVWIAGGFSILSGLDYAWRAFTAESTVHVGP
jgi:CDP-diacylglycerol--glycerol-3-phosphate 3-phosphatidyltransferase